jgi:electron transport complex protein RnfG
MARGPASTTRMIVTVMVVCAVAASCLALAYSVTKDRIAAQDRAAQLKALKIAFPSADEFVAASSYALDVASQAAGDTPVYGVYEARQDGQQVGWAVVAGPRGYGGPIRMVVGLDRDGKVVGVSIISMNETPGLGSQIVERASFLEQFVGVNASTAEADIKGLDMITGATKSSRGVRHGVEAAVAAYLALQRQGEGEAQ